MQEDSAACGGEAARGMGELEPEEEGYGQRKCCDRRSSFGGGDLLPDGAAVLLVAGWGADSWDERNDDVCEGVGSGEGVFEK